MTKDHRLSERVYTALKSDILDGELEHGRLNTAMLMHRYGTSATPVRETLLRLVGEGLLCMPSTGGFLLSAPDETATRDLYQFSLSLMLIILARRRTQASPLPDAAQPMSHLVPAIDCLFAGLARQTGSTLILDAVLSLNERMHRLRTAEPLVLKGLDREFSTLVLRTSDRSSSALRRAITSYHRRRWHSAARILAASLTRQRHVRHISARNETI
jgi:DNA-binding GntR family transcriptional regulator